MRLGPQLEWGNREADSGNKSSTTALSLKIFWYLSLVIRCMGAPPKMPASQPSGVHLQSQAGTKPPRHTPPPRRHTPPTADNPNTDQQLNAGGSQEWEYVDEDESDVWDGEEEEEDEMTAEARAAAEAAAEEAAQQLLQQEAAKRREQKRKLPKLHSSEQKKFRPSLGGPPRFSEGTMQAPDAAAGVSQRQGKRRGGKKQAQKAAEAAARQLQTPAAPAAAPPAAPPAALYNPPYQPRPVPQEMLYQPTCM
ncbi:hypothetical protein ABBQ38_010976 [Trebouxia sp. C0009 RCD-2024]